MKLHVFCTEPYRVPVAGKLNVCLFDKTGTLTTDELVAVGVLAKTSTTELTSMAKVTGAAGLVLAGCHSLIVYENETTGDPLESAALGGLRWHISAMSGNAEPAPAHGKIPAGQNIQLNGATVSSIEIKTRHHFSSKLQRMSCVIRTGGKYYSVAKGSPEAIGNMLSDKPAGYDEKAEFLAKQGYRVIALAYKSVTDGTDLQNALDTRAACENAMQFAGFIAFTCMVRKDTADVLYRLKDGGMSVAMVSFSNPPIRCFFHVIDGRTNCALEYDFPDL
jgi:manganese-transporting P-type ATPase